ncbi:beta-glucosidase [Didymosphaeria variabile]|uniref:beta-glucosidase n=1 Tax=Didymosphaeria variabile TaxID=1932322 RepID=A0A9W8XS15_9PLEO|nr:beta-glucosidase [Didymosphaeria variabile]KAJ4357611.1 beta-glucosidase [Didymosphaeria variabile]
MEHERQAVNCVVSERALREIYLAPFAIAIRDARPWALMSSYNKINGLHVSESKRLLTDVVRGEWGFDGFIMSDWFGVYSAAESVQAGLDCEMPGPPRLRGPNITVSLGSRKVTEYDVDDRVRNLLKLVKRVERLGIPQDAEEKELNAPETPGFARKLASSGIVLMKNERQVLPLDRSKSIAVMGPNAKFAAYSGGGSANLKPYYAVAPFEGISSAAKDVKYTLGAHAYKQLPLLSNLTKTNDGRKGLTARFYNEPPEVKERAQKDVIFVDASDMFLADYVHPDVSPELFYIDLEGTITPEVSGEYLFGCSVRGTARIFVDGELIVDNATKQTLGGTFMGAGTREERASIHLEQGKTYTVLLQFGSGLTQTVRKKGATAMRGGGVRVGATLKTNAEEEIDKAVQLAKEVDQVVICVGLSGDWESEGFDRPDMDLPGHTNALVSAVTKANSNTVVVNQSGTPVSMPWIQEVPALVQAWFGGIETGNAIADILFGDINPSGKLPLSFPIRNEDNPAFLNQRSERGRMLYGEDIYVGYRFYEKTKRDVLFAFGHGLSYTSFSLENLQVDAKDDTISVTLDLNNTGERDGAEVVQVYVSQRMSTVTRPEKELKGFRKVFLRKREKVKINIDLNKKLATSYWDEERDQWLSEEGTYDIVVGTSSDKVVAGSSFLIGKSTWWKGLH